MATDDRDPEVHRSCGRTFAELVEVHELASCGVAAGLQAGDLPEPSVGLCLGDPVVEVADDLDQAGAGLGVEAEAGTTDARDSKSATAASKTNWPKSMSRSGGNPPPPN
uniref:hypothetical protein n=1 Tax=Amycolatopsis sp. CA-293810 TaxID=3239926 RepID=UPI003F49616C